MNSDVERLVAEHGLRGVAAYYLKELRIARERRPGTVKEIQRTLRCFLRWLCEHLDLEHGSRVDPGVLSPCAASARTGALGLIVEGR